MIKRNKTENEKVKGKSRLFEPNAKRLKDPEFKIKQLKSFNRRSGMDIPFLSLILILLTIGLIMMFSASYPNAFYRHKNDSFFFIRNQAIFATIGLISMFFVSRFKYENLKFIHVPIFILSFICLIIVLFMPKLNNARRWIMMGPINFQPSEITKFSVILSFASIIDKNFEKMGTFKYGILPFMVILMPNIVLLALEPHISCTLIVILLATIMLFIGGIKLRWFLYTLAPIVFAVLYLVIFTDKLTYANKRIAGWLDPFNPPPGVDTWQNKQGLYAIGSGGIFGLGLGNSRQKYLYLPEPQNDFVFAIVCEELGFIGAVVILLLFAALIWRGVTIAVLAKDRFGTLLGLGLIMQVGLQVILNVSVVTGTTPNTGIELPFFSYGGTALLMLLTQMGLILSISRGSNIEKIR